MRIPEKTFLKEPFLIPKANNLSIDIGAHAAVTIIDRLRSKSEFEMRTIDCVIHPHASLKFIHDQAWDVAVDELNITFWLHESSSLDAQFILSGAQSSKREIKVVMLGEHSRARLLGGYVLAQNQQLEISCTQLHQAPNSESEVIFKGALGGHAQGTYFGTIKIEENASGSQASQENKNILLSERAHAISIPNLEALTNEIQCGHGSAVGHLDDQQIWYLQSRGIALEHAKKLLLQGFFADIVSPDMNIESLLEKVL